MRVLLRFTHGLGDAVQLTVVLKHLRKHAPNWLVDVWALHGKHAAHRGLCSRVFSDHGEQPRDSEYDQILNLSWFECHRAFDDVPSTKASLCLSEIFRITPDPELCRYEIQPTPEAELAADQYLHGITGVDAVDGRWPVAILHYQGNTSAEKKNLSHDVALEVCRSLQSGGLTPVILDWDKRSPLPDGKDIHCPDSGHAIWGGFGSGDAGTIAALIQRSQIMVGVDSGPLHVAGATTTPTIGVWTGHTPIRYFDFAENVTHLVPADWRDAMRDNQTRLFEERYRFRERSTKSMARDIASLAAELLARDVTLPNDGSLTRMRGFWVRKDNIAQDLVIINDVYERDCYKLAIIPNVLDSAEVVVDVGAHIGTFAKLVHQRNPKARIFCIEACPENLEALRANVGQFATVIHAACTYDDGELALCNAVRPNCISTGGSKVVAAEDVAREAQGEYWPDRRPLPKVTLEQLGQQYGFDRVDLLKLDCEGSEFSILGGCDLARVRFVIGEYHGQNHWDRFREQRLSGWDYGHMSQSNDMGNFHLRNPE